MTLTSIGDLAQNLVLRNRSAQLRRDLGTLTDELSSGRTADITARLGGDFSHLSDIDRSLRHLDGYGVATGEARLFAGAAQASLSRLHDMTAALATTLVRIDRSSLPVSRDQAVLQARTGLEDALGALNINVGGRHLFAGTATDRAPLVSAEVLLAGLKSALTGAVTVTDLQQAAQDWFDDPAGFRATVYQGSAQTLAPVRIGASESVSLSLRADDPAFRDILRAMALAALADDPDLGLDATGQSTLLRAGGEALLTGQARITGLQADLGFAEARIDEVATRNASARTGLEYARGELLAADPYDTASRLQDVQFQLESLYAVTVRNAQLSLLRFLE